MKINKNKNYYQLGIALIYSIAAFTPLDLFEAFNSNGELISPGIALIQVISYVCCFSIVFDYANSKYLKKFPYLLMAISLGGAFLTPFYLYDDIWAMAIQIMRQGFCLIFAVYIANLFSRDNS
tara:strand:+ start:298 stop:666 length:369 start_codon:yes stop_codon:yes gene_type:complete